MDPEFGHTLFFSNHLDLSDAIAAAQETGAADNSEPMLQSVRAALAPTYGHWRRFDEFLALNVQGMLNWRAGGQ